MNFHNRYTIRTKKNSIHDSPLIVSPCSSAPAAGEQPCSCWRRRRFARRRWSAWLQPQPAWQHSDGQKDAQNYPQVTRLRAAKQHCCKRHKKLVTATLVLSSNTWTMTSSGKYCSGKLQRKKKGFMTNEQMISGFTDLQSVYQFLLDGVLSGSVGGHT